MENYYQNQPEKVTRPPPVKSRLGLRTTGGGGEIVEVQGGHIVRATGRKDRHSKVCTAKGPKDRRVRLSAHTAIQFYDVQDRLGYDRPSKAVDWLITKAKSAIDELAELPPWKPANLEPNPNQENVNCSELRRFDELPDDEIVDTQMDNVQNSICLPDSIKSFFPMGGCSTPAINDNYSWPETGGFQSGFVFSSSPMQTTPFLQTQTTNSQLLNYVSQRGTLQSNNTPPVRAWVDPFSGPSIDQHQTLAFHYPSLMPGFTSELNGFSGFCIPAQIQGEEEEHDGISDKPSSASSDSRP